MTWKDAVNATLSRTAGYELRKVGARRTQPKARRRGASDRLVTTPVFVLSTVRSGSTLLRVLLNSHSKIHSPHELHLRDIKVSVKEGHPQKSLKAVGLDAVRLEYLLWDRLLHRELAATGKQILVNKTPSDAFIADRILECWPDARFIFLLRHPVAIARSRAAARPQDSEKRNHEMVLRYGNAVEDARRRHEGITVRYEDVTADPERETRCLCEWLGVDWEPTMLDYGSFDHGKFRPGMGDWKDKIKSGQIQPAAPLPTADEVPAALEELTRAWGYLPGPA